MLDMEDARTLGASLAVALGTLTIAGALVLNRQGFADSLPSALLVSEIVLGVLSGLALLLPLSCEIEAMGMWFTLTAANIYQLILLYLFYYLLSAEMRTVELSSHELPPCWDEIPAQGTHRYQRTRKSEEDVARAPIEISSQQTNGITLSVSTVYADTAQDCRTEEQAGKGDHNSNGEDSDAHRDAHQQEQTEHGLYALSKLLMLSHAQYDELLALPGMRDLLSKCARVSWQPLVLPPVAVGIACAVLLAKGVFGAWSPWCLFPTNATRVAWVHSQAFFVVGVYLLLLPALMAKRRRLRAELGEQLEGEEGVWQQAMRTLLTLSQAVGRTILLQALVRLPAAYSCTLLWAQSPAAPEPEDKDMIKTASAVFLPALSVLCPAYAYIQCDHDLRTRLFCRPARRSRATEPQNTA